MATSTSRTVRLRKKLVKIHRSRRLKKSIDYLREDVARHSKSDVKSVKLSMDLAAYVVAKVSRGMSPVKITVERSGDLVKVDLAPELKRKMPEPKKAEQKKPDAKPGTPKAVASTPKQQGAAKDTKPAPSTEKVK